MAKMIGDSRDTGCTYGKKCTCNGYYRSKRITRLTKRRERQTWKREVASEL
jgi:hypothetical protein